ncbi:hypothetical protein [Massilia eburnea]|uniref:hypothetical protein n=1 Tax=Massilia eburnea TaxID=1776165 RepID=UPI003D6A88E0
MRDLVRHRGHVVAAPLGIHRINTLFYNRKLFERLNIVPPVTWPEFEKAARQLRAGRHSASGTKQPSRGRSPPCSRTCCWRPAGPEYYRELFVRQKPAGRWQIRAWRRPCSGYAP